MLILSRRKEESVMVCLESGEEVMIKVLDIKGDSLRLGITAPKEIGIVREELLAREESQDRL